MDIRKLVRGGFTTRQAKTLIKEADPAGAYAPLDSPAFTGTPTVNGSPLSGGGATPGAAQVLAFPFAFDTPGIATGYDTGYAPAVGDILLDAWIDVVEAWDGTTPQADAGYYVAPTDGFGFFGWSEFIADLTVASTVDGSTVPAGTAFAGSNSNYALSAHAQNTIVPVVPARFTESHSIKIYANQTGEPAGAAAGSTVGQAVLYLHVASPGN